jgi:hypothetical protein
LFQNEFRVEEVKELLVNPKFKHYTVLGIGTVIVPTNRLKRYLKANQVFLAFKTDQFNFLVVNWLTINKNLKLKL